jgi:predicted DNA binding CopG/RHH family protein
MRDDNTNALTEAENDVRQTIKDIETNEKTFASEEANRNS